MNERPQEPGPDEIQKEEVACPLYATQFRHLIGTSEAINHNALVLAVSNLWWKLRLCKARGTCRNKCEPRKPERNPEAAWAEAVTFFQISMASFIVVAVVLVFLVVLLLLLPVVGVVVGSSCSCCWCFSCWCDLCVCVCETQIPQRAACPFLVNTAPGMMPPVQRKRRSQVWRPDKLDQTNWYCNYKAPLCRLSDSSQSSSRWCPFPFEPCRKDGEELSIPKTSAGLRGELAKRICKDFPTFRLFFFPEQLIHSPRCTLLGSPWTAQTFNNQTYQRSTSKSCHDTWVLKYWRTVPPSWSGLVFLKGARSWATQRPGFFLASSKNLCRFLGHWVPSWQGPW